MDYQYALVSKAFLMYLERIPKEKIEKWEKKYPGVYDETPKR